TRCCPSRLTRLVPVGPISSLTRGIAPHPAENRRILRWARSSDNLRRCAPRTNPQQTIALLNSGQGEASLGGVEIRERYAEDAARPGGERGKPCWASQASTKHMFEIVELTGRGRPLRRRAWSSRARNTCPAKSGRRPSLLLACGKVERTRSCL